MAEIKEKSIECKQEGCTASTDGKCIEGLTLDSCPHCTISQEEVNDEIIEQGGIDAKDISNKEIFEDVHFGEALTLSETRRITNSSITRLILLAGLPYTGKTTILASIFDLFQSHSKYSGYTFAGSQSLIGFEKRCHHSRIKSGYAIPDTERTKRMDKRAFLHLKVKSEDNIFTNLLFADISGETFYELSDSSFESKRFELAKRADHFALFIDSDQISDMTKRNIAKTRSISILRRLIEDNMIGAYTYIEVIFSRWDLLNSKTDVEIHAKFVDSIKDEIIRKISKTHSNIAFYNLASRPVKFYDFGYGISEIFSDWVEKTPFTCNEKSYKSNKYTNFSEREFSKYTHMELK